MFPKDILLIDFEGIPNPVQIGAVLLDKATLEEKDNFSSYIFSDLDGVTTSASGISQRTLTGAPTQAEVGRAVFERFGNDVLLAGWVVDADRVSFKKIVTAAGIDPLVYDYHVLDVWPLAYVYLRRRGYTGSFHSEEMFRAFGLPPRGLHDALEDCRLAATVLRKVVFE